MWLARILRIMLLVCASTDWMIMPPFNSMVENMFFSLKEKVPTFPKLFLCVSIICVLGRRWFHVERTVQTHNMPRFLIFVNSDCMTCFDRQKWPRHKVEGDALQCAGKTTHLSLLQLHLSIRSLKLIKLDDSCILEQRRQAF